MVLLFNVLVFSDMLDMCRSAQNVLLCSSSWAFPHPQAVNRKQTCMAQPCEIYIFQIALKWWCSQYLCQKLKVARTRHKPAMSIVKNAQMFWDESQNIHGLQWSYHCPTSSSSLEMGRTEEEQKQDDLTSQIVKEEELNEVFNDLFSVAHHETLHQNCGRQAILVGPAGIARWELMTGVDMPYAKEKAQEPKERDSFTCRRNSNFKK